MKLKHKIIIVFICILSLPFLSNGQAPCRVSLNSLSLISGQSFAPKAALFTLPSGSLIQEFTATRDLGGFVFVYNQSKVKAHMKGKLKKITKNATVVHNGNILGSYPDIIPFSLRISPDGHSVTFGVVLWKTWNIPIYWIVKDEEKFSLNGHYTEEIEFGGHAFPWFSPDGSKVAYMISVKDKKRIMINDKKVFMSSQARLENPWSPDGKQFALIARKNNEDKLVVDGKTTASARLIRLLSAPATYIAVDDSGHTLFIDGKKCIEAGRFHEFALSAGSSNIALSMTDGKGAMKVVVISGKCKVLKSWEQDGKCKEIRSLKISEDGKHVFFAASKGPGDGLFFPVDKKLLYGCGKEVMFDSITFGPDFSRSAWIVNGTGENILCAGGRKQGKWDRIELPLVFSKDHKTLKMYVWKKGELSRKTVKIK